MRDNGTKEVVFEYSQQGGTSSALFEGKPLYKVSIVQNEDTIELTAFYKVEGKVDLPSLGFVIYDVFGNPITGFNPKLYQQNLAGSYTNNGKITIKIVSPVLMDGVYQLSLWFGVNSEGDIQSESKCLSFEIVSMTKIKQLDSSQVGFVAPDCKYTFE